MKGASPVRALGSRWSHSPKEALVIMLHAGLDLSRRRLDVCLLDDQGQTVRVGVVPPDADGLRAWLARLPAWASRSGR